MKKRVPIQFSLLAFASNAFYQTTTFRFCGLEKIRPAMNMSPGTDGINAASNPCIGIWGILPAAMLHPTPADKCVIQTKEL